MCDSARHICVIIVLRDTKERGRDLTTVLDQYLKLVKPSYEEFCLPTKKYADVIIPRGSENESRAHVCMLNVC